MVFENLPLSEDISGWEGFRNRDKSEDLPYRTNSSQLSGRKAPDDPWITPPFLTAPDSGKCSLTDR